MANSQELCNHCLQGDFIQRLQGGCDTQSSQEEKQVASSQSAMPSALSISTHSSRAALESAESVPTELLPMRSLRAALEPPQAASTPQTLPSSSYDALAMSNFATTLPSVFADSSAELMSRGHETDLSDDEEESARQQQIAADHILALRLSLQQALDYQADLSPTQQQESDYEADSYSTQQIQYLDEEVEDEEQDVGDDELPLFDEMESEEDARNRLWEWLLLTGIKFDNFEEILPKRIKTDLNRQIWLYIYDRLTCEKVEMTADVSSTITGTLENFDWKFRVSYKALLDFYLGEEAVSAFHVLEARHIAPLRIKQKANAG